MASFYLNLFKDSISKYSLILRSWEQGLLHVNFRGSQLSPQDSPFVEKGHVHLTAHKPP